MMIICPAPVVSTRRFNERGTDPSALGDFRQMSFRGAQPCPTHARPGTAAYMFVNRLPVLPAREYPAG